MLSLNELIQYSAEVTRDPEPDLIVVAPIDARQVTEAVQQISAWGRPGSSEGFAQVARRLANSMPEVAAFRDEVRATLARPQHFCVLRGIETNHLSLDDAKLLLTTLIATICNVSDNTAYAEHSGSFSDEVRPSQQLTSDPTYQFDTEVHADESSKLTPEDIVALWAIQPAADGGDSQLWAMSDITDCIASDYGPRTLRFLKAHRFPFGGILRKPPRIVRAPILFGADGVRFRLGGIMDAFQVLGQTPTPEEEAALLAVRAAIRKVPPYQFKVGAGQGVIMLNRQTLHSRTRFRDPKRLLLRIRGFSDAFSVSRQDSLADWSDENPAGLEEAT
jgi:hypothetical protein